MKIFYAFALCMFLGSFSSSSQTTGDCEGAIPLCGGIYIEETAPPGTGDFIEYTGVCNQNIETMSLWYTFTVQDPGDLSFILTPATLTDDYDWALFDITTGGCAGITANGPSAEVSCNSYGALLGEANGSTGISTSEGGTGNSNGPGNAAGPPFNSDLAVTSGHTYALVVMNYTNSQDGYTIDFSGSSATIYDDVNPTLENITANCGNNEFNLIFSENIVVSSVQNLDFEISGIGGTYSFTSVLPEAPNASYYDQFVLQLDQSIIVPGIYTLTVTDANGSVEDACGNSAIDASITIELFAPITYNTSIQSACNGAGGEVVISDFSGGESPFTATLNGNVMNNFTSTDLSDGTYPLIVEDNNGCIVTSNIVVPDNPITVVIPEQDTLSCGRPSVNISGIVVSPEQAVTYAWFYESDGQFGSTGSTSISPTFSAPGVYQLIVTNNETGCQVESFMTLATEEIQFFDLRRMRFPNVITANKDSKNEEWAPYLDGEPNLNLTSIFEIYDLKIFDRWGKLIFDSEKNGGRRWSTNEAETGNYFYVLNYRITCGGFQEGKKEGWIQVLR